MRTVVGAHEQEIDAILGTAVVFDFGFTTTDQKARMHVEYQSLFCRQQQELPAHLAIAPREDLSSKVKTVLFWEYHHWR